MKIYKDSEGNSYTEEEVNKLAEDNQVTIDDIIANNELTEEEEEEEEQSEEDDLDQLVSEHLALQESKQPPKKKKPVPTSKAVSTKDPFGEVKPLDPLGLQKFYKPKKDILVESWDKRNKVKKEIVGPKDKNYGDLYIKGENKIGDYLTSTLKTPKATETFFAIEEEEGKETLEKLYAGIPGLTFEETNATSGDITNRFDAVKAVYIDPTTGERKESDILQFDIGVMNASAEKRPKLANKNANILKDFFNKNLKNINLAKNKALREESKLIYNKELNNSITPEFKAEIDVKFDAPNLFTPRKETYTGTSAAGGFAMGTGGGGSYIVKPYEEELKLAKKKVLADNPNITKEKLNIEADKLARSLLKLNAINNKKADFAKSIIENDKAMQSKLYVGSLLSNEEAVKVQNNTTTKLKLAENNALILQGLGKDCESILQGKYKTEAEAAVIANKFKSVGINMDVNDTELLTLKNGNTITKGFYDAYSKLKDTYDANNLYAVKTFKEQNDNLEKLSDSDIFSTAAAKNYDLSEKYLGNIGLGLSDILVGASYFSAKVLTGTNPISYAGDEISKLIYGEDAQTTSGKLDEWAVNYTKSVDDIRQSYVRDVSFEDAFSNGTNFGKFAAQEISQQIPILIAIAATGGAAGVVGVTGTTASTAMIGTFGAGGKMAQMQTEMAKGDADYSDTEIWLKSVGFGASEALFERMTTIPILKRANGHFASFGGSDVVDTSMKAYFKSKTPGFVYDQFLESAGETGTAITQNIIDGRPVMENVAHAGFSGFGMGTVMSGVPYTHGLYISAFSDYNSKKEIRNLHLELKDLGNQFELTKKSGPKKAIAKLMDSKQQEINIAIEKQQSKINENLRAGSAQAVISIESEKAKLQNEAKSIVDDKSIDDGLKELLIKDLRTKFNKLNDIKETALNPNNLMQDKSKFILLEASQPERYNNLIDQATVSLGKKGIVTDEIIKKEAYDLYLKEEIDINIENAGKVEGAVLNAYDTKKEAIAAAKINADTEKANNAKQIDAINEDENLSDSKKVKQIKALEDSNNAIDNEFNEISTQISEGADGYKSASGIQVVVKENMLENQRTQIATHEVGHYVFDKIFLNNEKAFIPIANQLLLTTQKLDKKLYNKLIKNTEKDNQGNFKATEVISRFLEAVSSGDISFAEKKNSFLSGLFGSMIQKEFIDQYDFDFKGQTDMFNFVVGLGKKIKSGELTLKEIQEASESKAVKTAIELAETKKYSKLVTGADASPSFSKAKVAEVQAKIDALEDQFDNDDVEYDDYTNRLANLELELKKAKALPENAGIVETKKIETKKTESINKEPRSKGNLQNLLDTKYEGDQKRLASEGLRNTPSGSVTNDFSKSIIGKELGGTVETITRRLYDPIAADAKRNVTRDEYKDALIQSAALLINNEFDASKQTLDKFISSRLNLRANALASELGIEGATKGGIKKDVEDQKALIAEETTVEVKEKPKYKNALESKVFPTEVIESGNKKALSVVRTLKSRIDAPVSLNRTVTPLIGEIKDEMGKLLDIDIKTAMGGKKDKQLEKFLLKGKRYILENMTTTWLMGKDGQGGMPIAIQKQIDGKWVSFPEWVGKKIDREKTTTDLAGRTSGAELVRRLPNVANNISDADFLAQVIGPDGNPLRGRKESLAKAMSEELAFELIKEDFETDGPILEAFNTNQERQGVEVTEVIKTEFEKQADRGNVKFSKASNKAAALFLLKEGGWRRNYLPYTQFYKDLSDSEKKSLNGFLNGTKSLIDKYEELWEKNAGVRYEKDIYVALRKANKYLTQVGLKLEEDIPDRFNSKKNDLVIIDENTDKKTVIELKSNPRDPLGSTSNGNFINNDLKYTKEFAGLQDLKDAQKSNAARTEFINYLKQLIKNGSKDIRLTPAGIQISKNLYKDLDRTGTTTNTEVNLQSLSDINSDKDILQIQNYGAFTFPGKSVGGIPPITGKIFASSEFRTNAAGKDGKWRTLTERVYFYLDPNFNQKTDFNLDTDQGAVKIFDAIRNSAKLSKAKKDAITNDAVTRSLNPKFSKTSKGISVFDFDDTSAFTSGSVLYTMLDGTEGKLNAEEFAKEGGNMLDAGAEFDFSEFSKVVNGKPGPMVEKMKKMIAKFGNENFFILTARPANAAVPIKEFLDSIGIDIPIENITGLGNSAAQAKADWMVGKATEGYNDFYFADDAIQNVQAVKKALNIPGVDSKVQQAIVKFSLTSKQDLKWTYYEDSSFADFDVKGKSYKIELADTAYIDYPELLVPTINKLIEKYNLNKDDILQERSGKTYQLIFEDYKGGTGITGGGNAAETFGVVINGVIEYAKNNNTETFVFAAKEPSRKKLYNAMAAIYANKLGWNAFYEDGVYIISKYPTREITSSFDGQSKQVKNALDVLDVKSKIQQAKIKFSKTISSEFNKIIEENTGMENYKVFSDIVARRRGVNKNKFDFYVPPSAADFELLLYNFIGKGTRGEEQQKFFADALLKPYANGNDLMDAARQSIKNDYKALINQFPGIKKKIESLTPDGDFTYDQAIRVALWTEEGIEIPGLSQRDQTKLVDLINNDPELTAFKQGVLVTGRQGKGWIAPTEYWDASTIISDLHNLTEGAGRKKFLAEFIENTEEMFGKFENGKLVGPNINKIEAVYGTNVREALDDQLYRMINGKNRSYGSDKETSMWSNWVNGSTGAIMFLNTRSAVLQLLGAVNFLNLRDNNPVAAGIAFANQKQYWADFSRIWNSDKIKERRGGLKEDVAAAEIANAAAGSKNKVNAVISYLLKIGYTPTQLADSFAIASGGAPFYRNRINTYLKEGQTEAEAEANAWSDFTKVSDETQQSGDPRDISKQQASPAGRLLLTFQNFSMQQSRIVKKSFLDLKNGRGDAKTHVAKIIYYLAVQNILFSVLQQGLFAVAFDDDDEELDKEKDKAKKKTLNKRLVDVADGVLDTILRGTGFLGGVISVLKNMTKKYLDEKDKGFKADYAKVMLEGANISPPIGSKLRKVYTGLQQTKFEKDLIAERGWGVMQDGRVHLGPMYGVTGKLVEATTNIPMDRLVNKIENVSQAMNSQNKAWQRVAVGLGFTPYSVGIEDTKGDLEIRAKAKATRKEAGKTKRKDSSQQERDSIANLSPDAYMDFVRSRKEARERKKDSIANLPADQKKAYLEKKATESEARKREKEALNKIKSDSIAGLSPTEKANYNKKVAAEKAQKKKERHDKYEEKKKALKDSLAGLSPKERAKYIADKKAERHEYYIKNKKPSKAKKPKAFSAW